MPIIVEDNRSKLKKRQSYRSQRPDSGETDRLTNRDKEYLTQAIDPAFEKRRERMLAEENPSFKYGGMKKKTKKMKTGGMSKARGTGCAIRGTKFKGVF